MNVPNNLPLSGGHAPNRFSRMLSPTVCLVSSLVFGGWRILDDLNTFLVNREIAFVQAVISAGIVHTVTKNCNTGELDNCKCSNAHEDNEEATRKGFRWAGCSDNTALGSKVAIAFLDDRETGHDLKAQIRLHNNEAGRNVSASF